MINSAYCAADRRITLTLIRPTRYEQPMPHATLRNCKNSELSACAACPCPPEGARVYRRRDVRSKINSPRTFLGELYVVALAAATPASWSVPRLPDPPPRARP